MALAYTSPAALASRRTNAPCLAVPFTKNQLAIPPPLLHPPSSSSAASSSSRNASAVVRAQQSEAAPPVDRFDVSSNCVQPVFRSTFTNPQELPEDDRIKILFLSESNVCRSVFAEAMLNLLIKERGLQNIVACSSKGTRDYNVGERPDANVIEVAEDLGLNIKDHTARLFDCAKDVVEYDLLLVMDKAYRNFLTQTFTASDALKDVTIYETIDKDNDYCWKVRRLGDFCLERKIEDIDDPLYGNVGGQEEVEELHRVALDIQDSCSGLAKFLSDIRSNSEESESLKKAVARSMGQMAPTEWVVPPMLTKT